MGKIGYLAGKTISTIKEEGIVELAKKTKRYILKENEKNYQQVKDILFINGCYLPHPSRYRVNHQIEQLNSNNVSCDQVFFDKLTLDLEKYYRGFVFFRCPITDTVKEFIEKAKINNKTVFYDIDDLVFDKEYTKTIKHLKTLSKEELDQYYDGVQRMQDTLKLCDYATTTTEVLANELNKYVKETFVNRNNASERMCELSLKAIENVKRDEDKVILGYLSGSITHNADFELILPAITKLMKNRDNVYLKVVGLLDIPEELKPYKNRILKAPFVDWMKLPEIIASIDINLAPLEESLFNEAKSENKWTEAALVKVPTIASNVGAFKIIDDNKDGILVDNNSDEWYKKLEMLVDNNELRKQLANNAFDRALKNYVTTYSGYEYTQFIKSKLAPSIAFVLPTTNISGGINVIVKHCNILKKHGYDVFAINMDYSNEDIINKDGILDVVCGVQVNKKIKPIDCHIDKMVASLWSTLYFCLDYHKVDKISYLVQNYETNFMDYGQYLKQQANSTYVIDNVEYLTISKWCEDWLKKDFKRKVKYAPNGINLNQFPIVDRKFDKKIKILIEGNSDDYYKNVDESFKIIEKLDKSKYEIHYLSYQGEPKKWYYVDKFLHKVPYDEVGKIYGSCDILIKSSKLESFSYPPLEMMATGGIALVAPNEGNVEYLKDMGNCIMYTPGNIEEAVEKIENIRNNKELRDKIIKGGLKTAKERSWDKIEKDIIDLYNL